MTFLQTTIIISSIVFALRLFVRWSTRWCKIKTKLTGKTAIVTGANSGIGFEIALDFAKRDARVILACRNRERANEARVKIVEKSQNAKVVVRLVDFLSFASVRRFADEVNRSETRLDLLVNNAGASSLPAKKTADGNLMMIQTNYLSGFLLTQLLGNLLKKTGSSRVINIGSVAANSARLKINALNVYKGDNQAYCCSKLCNILFTRALAERLKGTSVLAFSIHPGYVNSQIYRNLSTFLMGMYIIVFKHFFKTCREGAQTAIYVAVADDIAKYSGEHFYNCARVKPYSTVERIGLAQELWDKTVKMVNLRSEECQL